MNRQSKRQAIIEGIRKKQKIVAMTLSSIVDGGLIKCACCRVVFGDGFTPEMDEIRGRHQDTPLPSSVDPMNHQLLCRSCHRIKTEAKDPLWVHKDYRSERLRNAMRTYYGEIIRRLPELAGTMKYRIEDIREAVNGAHKVNYFCGLYL